MDEKDFMEENNVDSGEIDGYKYYILKCPISDGYNGYIRFNKRPVREQGYFGLLTYVPVHGGLTYATENKYGMTYGFDTAHCDSDTKPITDKKWIKKQITIMLKGILLAKELESKYLKCVTNKGKAKHADKILALQIEESNNLGVNLNLLSGSL